MYIINRNQDAGGETSSGGFGAWSQATDIGSAEKVDETPIEDPAGELKDEDSELNIEDKKVDDPDASKSEGNDAGDKEAGDEGDKGEAGSDDPDSKKEDKDKDSAIKKEENEEEKEDDSQKAAKLFDEIKAKEENKGKTDEEIEALVEEELNKDSSDFELNLPGEGDAEESEETNSWIDLADHLGIEKPEEESVDAFKASLEKTIQDRVKKATEGLDEFKELTPRAKQLVKLFDEKGEEGLNEFLNPNEHINKFLSLSDENLLREEYRAMKDPETGKRLYNDEQVESKIEYFRSNEDEMKHKADFIREDLNRAKAAKQAEFLKSIENDKAYRESREKQFDEIETKKIISTIESTNEFMNSKLNEKVAAKLKADWESGEMQRALNDPDVLVKSYLFHILGEQGMKNLEKQAFEKGRNKMRAKLHKLPVINGNSESNGRTQQSKNTGGFGSWGEGLRGAK